MNEHAPQPQHEIASAANEPAQVENSVAAEVQPPARMNRLQTLKYALLKATQEEGGGLGRALDIYKQERAKQAEPNMASLVREAAGNTVRNRAENRRKLGKISQLLTRENLQVIHDQANLDSVLAKATSGEISSADVNSFVGAFLWGGTNAEQRQTIVDALRAMDNPPEYSIAEGDSEPTAIGDILAMYTDFGGHDTYDQTWTNRPAWNANQMASDRGNQETAPDESQAEADQDADAQTAPENSPDDNQENAADPIKRQYDEMVSEAEQLIAEEKPDDAKAKIAGIASFLRTNWQSRDQEGNLIFENEREKAKMISLRYANLVLLAKTEIGQNNKTEAEKHLKEIADLIRANAAQLNNDEIREEVTQLRSDIDSIGSTNPEVSGTPVEIDNEELQKLIGEAVNERVSALEQKVDALQIQLVAVLQALENSSQV